MPPRKSSYAERQHWFQSFPLHENGTPVSAAAFELISHLFRHRNRAQSIDAIAAQLGLHVELVYIMCRHLELIELVIQEPSGSRQFRYDVHSPNAEVQARVEAALVDYRSTLSDAWQPPQAA